MRSIGDDLDANDGIGPGFDTLRVLLSVGVIFVHSVTGRHGDPILKANFLFQVAHSTILPAFFALSGFLVMGSAMRHSSLSRFLSLRCLRIVPALSTEIFLAALLLGPIATVLSLQGYFTNHQTWRYVFNVIGWVHYELPGVFSGTAVNISLWSIQPEITCYLFLALMFLGLWHRTMSVVLAALLFLIAANLLVDITPLAPDLSSIGTLQQARLFTYFVGGAVVYHLRYYFPQSIILAFSALVVFAALMPLPIWRNLSVLPIAYCVAVFGTCPLPKGRIISSGDYSYGLYLYGFPLQQMQVELFPHANAWYWNFITATPVAFIVAAASWRFVEKPFLRLRAKGNIASKPNNATGLAQRFGIALSLVSYFVVLLIWSSFFALFQVSLRLNLLPLAGLVLLVSFLLAVLSLPTDSGGSQETPTPSRLRPISAWVLSCTLIALGIGAVLGFSRSNLEKKQYCLDVPCVHLVTRLEVIESNIHQRAGESYYLALGDSIVELLIRSAQNERSLTVETDPLPPRDAVPITIDHPALFQPKTGAAAAAATAAAAAAQEAASKMDRARLVSIAAYRERAQAMTPVRKLQMAKIKAERELSVADRAIASAPSPEAKTAE